MCKWARPGTIISDSLASPQMAIWDFVLGRQTYGGETFASETGPGLSRARAINSATGTLPASFPRDGLVWSFDFLDQGKDSKVTNWPFFVDRGNNSAVATPCDNGYAVATACGYMNSGHGTSMNAYGIQTNANASGYGGHFHTAPASTQSWKQFKTLQTRCRATDRILLSGSIVMRVRRSLAALAESGLPARYRAVTIR